MKDLTPEAQYEKLKAAFTTIVEYIQTGPDAKSMMPLVGNGFMIVADSKLLPKFEPTETIQPDSEDEELREGDLGILFSGNDKLKEAAHRALHREANPVSISGGIGDLMGMVLPLDDLLTRVKSAAKSEFQKEGGNAGS